jgi:HEAT repeat protein
MEAGDGRSGDGEAQREQTRQGSRGPAGDQESGVDELIQMALDDKDSDGTTRWQAITTLQARGDLETFTVARRLCASASAGERVLGVDILGELGRDRPFTDRTLPVLRYLAVSESDPHVLYSVLIAFGHLRDVRALPSVIELSGSDDPVVRYGAAYALPNVMGNPPDPTGLSALRRLAADTDEDVADWASLGLTLTSGGKVKDFGRQILDP